MIDKIDYLSLLSERWEGSAMMAPLPLPLAQAAATGQIWGIRRAISDGSDSRAQDIRALKASGERPGRGFEQRGEASAIVHVDSATPLRAASY